VLTEMRRLLVLLAVLPLAASPALAWVVAGHSTRYGVALDSNGDVGVAGSTYPEEFLVAKYHGAGGTLLWETSLGPDTRGVTITADAADDFVAVGGYTDNTATVVAKFDGVSGALLWRHDVGSVYGAFIGTDPPVLDGFGRVLVTASTYPLVRSVVVALDANDGSELWRVDLPNYSAASVAPHPSGDVAVAAYKTPGPALHVLRLAGANGAVVWEAVPGPLAGSTNVMCDPGGDVIASAGNIDGNNSAYSVVRVSGIDGSFVWQSNGAMYGTGQLLPAANGDVFSLRSYASTGSDLSQLVRLEAATGNALWTSSIGFHRVSLLPNGDLVGAGSDYPATFTLARVSGASGATRWRLPTMGNAYVYDNVARGSALAAVGFPFINNTPDRLTFKLTTSLRGKKLVVRDVPADPASNALKLQSKDPLLAAPFADGSPQDPTVGGGALTLRNPTTAEAITIPLPASDWSPITSSKPGGEGMRYRDSTGTAPCRVVVLRSGKMLKAKCQGPLVAYTLDEAAQGSLRVELRVGSGPVPGPTYCLEFGGSVVTDVGTAVDGRGLFIAKDSPAPTDCTEGL
jgi:hypothetical protein